MDHYFHRNDVIKKFDDVNKKFDEITVAFESFFFLPILACIKAKTILHSAFTVLKVYRLKFYSLKVGCL